MILMFTLILDYVGIKMAPTSIVRWENGQGDIEAQLRAAGKEVVTKYKGGPSLIVVVLPEGGNEIYTAVKQCVSFVTSLLRTHANIVVLGMN